MSVTSMGLPSDAIRVSHSFVLRFFVQNLFVIGVAFAGDLLDARLTAEAKDLPTQ